MREGSIREKLKWSDRDQTVGRRGLLRTWHLKQVSKTEMDFNRSWV